MPLKLNNVEDIFAHNVFLLNSQGSGYDEVRDLINAGGGGGSGLITSVSSPLSVSSGNLSISLLNYVSNSALLSTLAGYTDTTNLNILLAAKQNLLTAGNNITISNNTISSNNVILQIDGVTQNATHLNFLSNNASLVNNVLNVSRLTQYVSVRLILGFT